MSLEYEHIGRSILPSHPDYPVLNELSAMICLATNFHAHFNGFNTVEGISGQTTREPAIGGIERLAIIDTLKESMWHELHCGRFADFINGPDFKLSNLLESE